MKINKQDPQFYLVSILCGLSLYFNIMSSSLSVVFLILFICVVNLSIIPNMKIWIQKIPNIKIILNISMLISFSLSMVIKYLLPTSYFLLPTSSYIVLPLFIMGAFIVYIEFKIKQ